MSGQLPRKGEAVVALGAPHGLSFTATRGIISAVRSAAEMAKDLGDSSLKGTWVQVDAALSPGNSGGPLINAQGQVVAMSTLASRGSAQNLNFGISGDDIRQAIQTSQTSPVVPLVVGVAKIRSKESSGGGGRGEGERDSILNKKNIPAEVFNKYAQDCKEAFPQLSRELRKESGRLELKIKEMLRGQTFIPPDIDDDGVDIVRIRVPFQKSTRWFFRSDSIKNREISREEARVREINKLKSEVKSIDDPQSVYKLAWNFGPKLDTRRNNSIGFVTDAVVLHAGNAHEALILYEETPYLMWIDSTAGLTLGEQVTPRPFYVNGTATAMTKNGSVAVTVLQSISEEELQGAFKLPKGNSTDTGLGLVSNADGFRMWNDKSGKFSIEAVLLSTDGKKARLKRRDGKVIEVPIANLSAADAKYLKDF
jgi:SLA1 homology domain 1, SHD1/Trypsin-like peptidase domain